MTDDNFTPRSSFMPQSNLPQSGEFSTGSSDASGSSYATRVNPNANKAYFNGDSTNSPSFDALIPEAPAESSVPAPRTAGSTPRAAASSNASEISSDSIFPTHVSSNSSEFDSVPDVARRSAGSSRRMASSHAESAPARDDVQDSAEHDSEHRSQEHKRPRVPRARRMKLALTHIDPWSVAKVSFLLAVAISLIIFIALYIAWTMFSASSIMASIQSMVSSSGLDSATSALADLFSTKRVMSILGIMGIANTVIITIVSVINAFLYNIVARLVGGLSVTLGDD